MKTNYTNEQLQNAIDAACEETYKSYPKTCGQLILAKDYFPASWPKETPARLHLLKTSLDHLPEPPPPVVKAEQADPYAELKAAHAAGKVIQILNAQNRYVDAYPTWHSPPEAYRIKPEPEVFIHAPWTPKVGDVVRLKSGGPKMTVDATTGVNAFCRWFDMNGSNQLNFNLATLMPA